MAEQTYVLNVCHLCSPPDDYPELVSEERLHFNHYATRFGDENRYVWINGRLNFNVVECATGTDNGWVVLMLGNFICTGKPTHDLDLGTPHFACMLIPGLAVDVSTEA